MKYAELVASGYMAKNDYNCAETMLYSSNEYYRIGLDETARQVANAFGGGMGKERACGALTGALMALGCMFATTKSHQDERMKEIRDKFVSAFIDYFGSTECVDIKKTHKDPEIGCHPVVAAAAEILENIIEQYETSETS